MFIYYTLVFLFSYIKFGLGKTAIPLGSEDPAPLYESDDSIPNRRALRGLEGKAHPVYNGPIFTTEPLQDMQHISETRHINLVPKRFNQYTNEFNDEHWPSQWYFHDQRTVLGPVMDHNIVPVYHKRYKRHEIFVAVIGDGVQHGLDELPKVKKGDTTDARSSRFHADPDVTGGTISAEGTMMAGVIAMQAGNLKCGVGVAYDAIIVGIKIASQKSSKVYDYQFAQAIKHNRYETAVLHGYPAIYAFAIGRPDDGIYMANPRNKKYVENAFVQGMSEGKIYVVGAGDGKTTGGDNCGADDFVNDPAAIGIASADHKGKVTPYSERCAAVMATAYSSGDGQAMVSVDARGSCTQEYSGNNPSVGIAAGIFALTIQAKPGLTPRDIQHLVAMTSEVAPLVQNEETWKKNAAGFYVSNDFGFGLLNAANMVIEALNWISVPPELKTEDTFYFDNKALTVETPTTGTVSHQSQIAYVEVVEIICNVRLEYRGSVTIKLKSPSDTEVLMLDGRPLDRDRSGLEDWRLKTAHFWSELAKGTWTLTVSIDKFEEEGRLSCLGSIIKYLGKMFGSLNKIDWVKLIIHGTKEKPARYISRNEPNSGRRTYSAFNSIELHGRHTYQRG